MSLNKPFAVTSSLTITCGVLAHVVVSLTLLAPPSLTYCGSCSGQTQWQCVVILKLSDARGILHLNHDCLTCPVRYPSHSVSYSNLTHGASRISGNFFASLYWSLLPLVFGKMAGWSSSAYINVCLWIHHDK